MQITTDSETVGAKTQELKEKPMELEPLVSIDQGFLDLISAIAAVVAGGLLIPAPCAVLLWINFFVRTRSGSRVSDRLVTLSRG